MDSRRVFLLVISVAIGAAVQFGNPSVHADEPADLAISAQSPQSVSPLEVSPLIIPSAEDYPLDMAARVRLPQRPRSRDKGSLFPLRPGICLINGLGGGVGSGPGSLEPNAWYSSTYYIIYKTPEDARKNWKSELYYVRAIGFSDGSFSGDTIGDECGAIFVLANGWIELHVVRDRVSFWIAASINRENARTEQTAEEAKEALEATAKVIVNRIDAVVRAKGAVDMTNLPPVRETAPIVPGTGKPAREWTPRSISCQSRTTHCYEIPQLDRLPFSLYFVPFDAGTDAPVTVSNAREYLQRVTVKRRSALESLYKHLQQEIAPGSEFHDGRIRLYMPGFGKKGDLYVDDTGCVSFGGRTYLIKPRPFLDLSILLNDLLDSTPPD